MGDQLTVHAKFVRKDVPISKAILDAEVELVRLNNQILEGEPPVVPSTNKLKTYILRFVSELSADQPRIVERVSPVERIVLPADGIGIQIRWELLPHGAKILKVVVPIYLAGLRVYMHVFHRDLTELTAIKPRIKLACLLDRWLRLLLIPIK